jgi:preprotein translocase subunit SecD
MSPRVKFGLIIALAVVAAFLSYPREDAVLQRLGFKGAKLQLRQGLDLQGGAHLVYQADVSKLPAADRTKALTSLVDVIQRRVNPSGTSEVNVQLSGNNRVVVELPGIKDLTQAISTIGKSANLSFLEVSGISSGQPSEVDTGISGKDVDSANVDFDTTTGKPIVSLQMKAGDATKRFGEATTRINQSGSQLVTMLDQDIIFGPATVSNPITDGKAQLQGSFTVDQARQIAQLINAGALPVPINLVQQQTVGATLGADSIAHSLVAGIIGLGIVALFMILYYRLLGVVAVAALVVYTLLTISLYKLSVFTPAPIVLTLAGIAGFILSIGMAVDANILIFERTKEEIRDGKSLLAGIEAGFDRAWPSIRDSNISTLLTCFILYNFSGSVPIIKGFAITLGLGVVISMFTAIVVSRTFLRILVRSRWGRGGKWYGLEAS